MIPFKTDYSQKYWCYYDRETRKLISITPTEDPTLEHNGKFQVPMVIAVQFLSGKLSFTKHLVKKDGDNYTFEPTSRSGKSVFFKNGRELIDITHMEYQKDSNVDILAIVSPNIITFNLIKDIEQDITLDFFICEKGDPTKLKTKGQVKLTNIERQGAFTSKLDLHQYSIYVIGSYVISTLYTPSFSANAFDQDLFNSKLDSNRINVIGDNLIYPFININCLEISDSIIYRFSVLPGIHIPNTTLQFIAAKTNIPTEQDFYFTVNTEELVQKGALNVVISNKKQNYLLSNVNEFCYIQVFEKFRKYFNKIRNNVTRANTFESWIESGAIGIQDKDSVQIICDPAHKINPKNIFLMDMTKLHVIPEPINIITQSDNIIRIKIEVDSFILAYKEANQYSMIYSIKEFEN